MTSTGESTMAQQIPVDPHCEVGEEQPDGTMQVAPDLSYQRLLLVNVAYYGQPDAGPGGWVLIDAGVMGTYHTILGAAEKRFGAGNKPAAIVMTHGHFDHVGALKDLAEHWDVPIYAPRAGAAVSRRPLVVPAARPDGRRRADGDALAALSPRADRRPAVAPSAAGRWERAGHARIPMAAHAGARAGPRLVLARGRPDAHRRRRLHHDDPGVGLRRA